MHFPLAKHNGFLMTWKSKITVVEKGGNGAERHLKDNWISSRVLPLVSGTKRHTNARVKALTRV